MAKRLKKANDENDDLKNENSKLKNEIKDLNKKNKDLEKIMEDNKKLIEDHCSKVWKEFLYFCDGPIIGPIIGLLLDQQLLHQRIG